MVKTIKNAKSVAHVHEDETNFITLHRADGDRSLLSVSRSLCEHLQLLVDIQRQTDHLDDILDQAYQRLVDEFGDRIDAIATKLVVHDGELVIRVKPKNGIFDSQLAVELNELAWELEDTLYSLDSSASDHITLGFRQEFPDEQEVGRSEGH